MHASAAASRRGVAVNGRPPWESCRLRAQSGSRLSPPQRERSVLRRAAAARAAHFHVALQQPGAVPLRSEHTSELQSQSNLVCRLLLEKKKNNHSSEVHWTDRPDNTINV